MPTEQDFAEMDQYREEWALAQIEGGEWIKMVDMQGDLDKATDNLLSMLSSEIETTAMKMIREFEDQIDWDAMARSSMSPRINWAAIDGKTSTLLEVFEDQIDWDAMAKSSMSPRINWAAIDGKTSTLLEVFEDQINWSATTEL